MAKPKNDMLFKLEDLVTVYMGLLGKNYYNIEINCNLNVRSQATVEGIMFAARKPFSISGLGAQTVELNFEFYVNVTRTQGKLNALDNIANKILGTKTGEFKSNGLNLTYNSFLEFGRPISAPVVDAGQFTQVVMVNGSCFVSLKEGGVMMSNDIITSLTFKGVTERVYPDTVSIFNQRVPDIPQKLNMNESTAIAEKQNISRTLRIYLRRTPLHNALIDYIENLDDTADTNEPIIITRKYPNSTIGKDCILLTGNIIERPGAFAIMELVIQRKQED